MDKNEVLSKVQEVFRDVLDNEVITLNEAITADDLEEWDSLTHVQIIAGLEKEFGIKFTSKEILFWENVGDMVESICSRI